jgi:TonB-linked SusC/RagA family outer membrane protein
MRISLLTFLCLVLALHVGAQEKLISGKVFSGTEDSTLPGASVSLKGTKKAVLTDSRGLFQLKVPESGATLIVEHVGFTKKEMAIGSLSFLNIPLVANPSVLSDVVVVAYGQQSRKTLTSAIASVSSKDIANIPAAGSDQLLQGRASGVLVNTNSGAPGGGVSVRIRGTSSINASSEPLYVVDGIPIQSSNLSGFSIGGGVTSPIADINPADIESMEVLKDASATAIYGARAANGVVLITTKKGSVRKTKIALGVYYGKQNAINKPDVVDGPTFEKLINESVANNWVDNYGSLTARNPRGEVFKPTYANPDTALNTDWVSPIFRTGALRNVDLSISGGSDKLHYLVSYNNYLQEAMLKNSDFSRNTFRVNMDFSPIKHITVGTNILYSLNNRTRGRSDDNISGGLEGAFFFPTNLPYYQRDGSYTKFGTFESPLAAVNNTDITMRTGRLLGTVFAEYELIKNLKFRANFSYDNSDVQEDMYDDSFTNAGGSVNGSAQSISLNNRNWVQENVLSYSTKLGGHNLSALVGTSSQESVTSSVTATGTQFPSDDFRKISAAAVQTSSSTATSNGLSSFFSRISYDYKSKYLATVNIRRDGSSRFGPSNKWGTFPSVALGWNVAEENFFDKIGTISNLKLRASYGATGNQSGINDFQSAGLWEGGPYAGIPGINPIQLANPNLKWETTYQTDLGIDIGLFKNRLNIAADYYDKQTKDMLLAVSIPRTSGFENLVQNYGAMQNRGIELSVIGDALRSKNLTWNVNFNIAGNRNKIKKLAAPFFVYNRDIYKYEEGGEMFSFYLHEQTGVDPKTGAPTFTDVNGDGVFNPNVDRKIVGTANPDFFGGLTNTINYKNFDFMFFFQYSYGNEQLNWNLFFLQHGGTRSSNYSTSQLERWQKPGDITMVPRQSAAN